MKSGGGRSKGKRFEREVVRIMREAFELDVKDCYRTPLSGGHFAASKEDPGDLFLGPIFQRSMPKPLCIECKNCKDFEISRFWSPKLEEMSWPETQALRQVLKASGKDKVPVLIFNYRQKIWCCCPEELRHKDLTGLFFTFGKYTFCLNFFEEVIRSWQKIQVAHARRIV